MKRDHLLILALICVLSILAYSRDLANKAIGRQANLQHLAAQQVQGRPGTFFVDVSLNSVIPPTFPRPQSEWLANERQFYRNLLAGSHYDVLVAPVQLDGWGFDRATRSLMSAELTEAIARSLPGKTLDSYLAAKILGEAQRAYSPAELYQLANIVGAKRLIFIGAGHNRRGSMNVSITSQLRAEDVAGGIPWTTPTISNRVLNIPIDDGHSVIESLESRIPEILQGIGIEPAAAPAMPISRSSLAELPPSPLGLVSSKDNPARDAYTFLLFSALTPQHIERTRERFIEKAFLASSRMSPASPEYRALRARSYMWLGFRDAAKRVLGTPASIEEREIQAVLDGNLPDVKAQGDKERDPLKRLLAQLDINRISVDYGLRDQRQSVDAAKSMNLPGNIWPFLAARAFLDWDGWSQFDNAPLKALIDHELPVEGYSLKALTRGALSLGDAEKLRTTVDLSVFNHSQMFIEAHASQSRDESPGRVTALDYMELLSATGDDNLIRRIDFLNIIQGEHQDALRYADNIQTIFKGNAYYTVARSEAERALANDVSDAERGGLIKVAYEDGLSALYWEQTQSRTSTRALADLNYAGIPPEYGFFDNFYYPDLPFHPFYMIWAQGGAPATVRANGLAALRNATSEFSTVLDLIGPNPAIPSDQSLFDVVMQQIKGRFIGSPQREKFLADHELQLGNDSAAENLLREAISITPDNRDLYFDLGILMAHSGRESEASKVFLSYPGLRPDSTAPRVLVANTAGAMGELFYMSGELELAKPLLQIAASKKTGASAELESIMQLRLLDGDINGALSSALERAQHYHEARAYRDYLNMLYATGHLDDAWAGFGTLIRELQEPQIWDSALVGHHMAARSEAEVAAWVQQPEFRKAGNDVSNAINSLARFATMDRTPSEQLSSELEKLDSPTWQFDNGPHFVVRAKADGRGLQVLGPAGATMPTSTLQMGLLEGSDPKHRVRPQSSYFVAAYRELKLHHFPEAKRIFEEAAAVYEMAAPPSSYMLPYYALASVQAGPDFSGVEQILGRIGLDQQQFDYQLAKAVLEAGDGKAKEAMLTLKLARYRRTVNPQSVLLTQFAYGDVCESLYGITGNEEIRTEALDWARSREKAEPWQAWSYAMEVTLAHDPMERQRAIAMTHYLDPKSPRLSTLPRSTLDEAVSKFGSENIFLKNQPHAPTGKGAAT